MITIANAFALSMLPAWRLDGGDPVQTAISVRPVADPAAWLADAESRHGPASSAVGHADTAGLFSALLGREVPDIRRNVVLAPDDELLVGQYVGPRLPEGCTTLPDGATVRWIVVTIDD